MKKMVLGLMVLAAAVICHGEVAGIPSSVPAAYHDGSLPTTLGGLFYSNATRAMYRSPRVDLSKYKVLGKVEGEAQMENFVFCVNLGDTSFHALKKDALKNYPDADDIVNFDIDAHHFNVFVFYFQTTVKIRGIAVKYLP